MKKQLLNLSVAFAATMLLAGTAVAQLTAPIHAPLDCPAIQEAGWPMTIDGAADEANWSAAQPVEVTWTPAGDVDPTVADFSGSFKVCWNNHAFYFYAEMTDDVEHSYLGNGLAAGNSWEFDNVEVFFNADTAGVFNSKLYAPDGIQLRLNRAFDTISLGWGNGEAAKADTYDDVWYTMVQDNGASGWKVELELPWAYILPSGKTAADLNDYVANHMGFDVSLADSDGTDPKVGARASGAQMGWDGDATAAGIGNGDEDNAWQDVRKFGIINLVGTPYIGVNSTSNSEFQVYPNPATGVVNFSNLDGVTSIEIVNMIGQMVKAVEVNATELSLNISDLSSGMYFANIKAANSTTSVRFLVK